MVALRARQDCWIRFGHPRSDHVNIPRFIDQVRVAECPLPRRVRNTDAKFRFALLPGDGQPEVMTGQQKHTFPKALAETACVTRDSLAGLLGTLGFPKPLTCPPFLVQG
jgi:hypothetical protein